MGAQVVTLCGALWVGIPDEITSEVNRAAQEISCLISLISTSDNSDCSSLWAFRVGITIKMISGINWITREFLYSIY